MHFNSIYGLGMIAMDKIGSCSRKKTTKKLLFCMHIAKTASSTILFFKCK